ncbi:hypothetical protein SY91_00446 [Burkholderia cenocepacia]|nr:hypothetical protein SY91_00446 [Burkholderia cenocepacia]
MVGRCGEARMARRMAGDPRGRRASGAADAARECAPRERRCVSRHAACERNRRDRDRPARGEARVGAAGGAHSGLRRRRGVGAGRRRAARGGMARRARRHARARRVRCARRQDGPYSRTRQCGSRGARKRRDARGAHRRESRAPVARGERVRRRRGCAGHLVRRASVRSHPGRRAVLGVRHRAAAPRHPLAAPRGRHPGAGRGAASHPVGAVAAREAGRRTALRDLFDLPGRRRIAGPLV